MNYPPVAKLTANKTELVFPDVDLVLDASSSYDLDKDGNIVTDRRLEYTFYKVSGPSISIESPTAEKTNVKLLEKVPADTAISIGVSVKDRRGLVGNTSLTIPVKAEVIVVPPVKPIFGVKIQGDLKTEDQIAVVKLLNLEATRPSGVAMDTYTGLPSGVKKFLISGLFCTLNFSYTNTSGSNTVEHLPPTLMSTFKSKFELFCKDLVPYKDNIVLVCENEPINRGYFTGDFSNYIEELKASVEIASKYGIKVVSGCVHIELVEAVRLGMTGDTRITDTKRILDTEKALGVAWTNIHDQYNKGEWSVYDFGATVEWLSNYTGHPVGSNEISMKLAPAHIAVDYMNFAKKCGMPVLVFWSGDTFNGTLLPGGNSDADAFNDGYKLSDIGLAVQKEML